MNGKPSHSTLNRFMKSVLLAAACIVLLFPAGQGWTADAPAIRVMTYNIRYNNPDDGVNAWPNRKENVAKMIGTLYQADLAGLQEVLYGQLEDLERHLPAHYTWVGVGRGDGYRADEYSPIFINTERFELLATNCFWLSEKPEIPGSKSWDTAITRIVTWVKLKEKTSGKEFYYFNTHFDHRGRIARVESAKLLWRKIAEIAGESPTVVTGDFNSRESSEPYATLVGKQSVDGSTSDLADARYVTKTPHQGPTSTSTNWVEQGPPETKIDYIFVRREIQVLSHRGLDDRFDNQYTSHHNPVFFDNFFTNGQSYTCSWIFFSRMQSLKYY